MEEVKITEEVKEERKPEPKRAKKVDVRKWQARTLKVINEMPDKAKAKKIAARVLKHK